MIRNPVTNRPVWLIIARRELTAFYSGPIAYIVAVLFLSFSGFLFFSTFFLINRAELRNFFSMLPVLFAFFIPALTMRLFSEETRSGSIETLMTLPVSPLDVAVGKFTAAFVSVTGMLVPTLVYAGTVVYLGSPDPKPLVGGYIGTFFLAAAFSAIGVFASSLTKNQIVAFFIAFTVCMVLALIDRFLVLLPAAVVGPLEFLSAGRHFESVARGIIDSRDLVYFLSLTVLFLALTVKALDTGRDA